MSRAGENQEPSEKRRWLAILLATALSLAVYIIFIYSLAAASGDEVIFAGGLLGIGLGLVPCVFAIAAFVSQNPTSVKATLWATGLWVLAVVILFFDVPTGLVAGFGAGGMVAFRLGNENSYRARAVAVALCALYTFIMLRISPELG
ncbi:MAG: hypothetical protein WAL25_09710, partial [Acidimicrobiia bacterium]